MADLNERGASAAGPGAWAWAGILLVSLVVLYTGTARYLDPVGEKYMWYLSPGGADLSYPFNGARALLMGVDPYVHEVPDLFDPWGRDEPVGGVMFRQFYPPSHLVLYVPLAWATDGDFRFASRVWFHLNLVFLAVLSCLTCALIARVLGRASASRDLLVGLLPILLFTLGTNVAASLALERGQSSIFGSMLCWSAALLWLRGARFWPLFLAVSAASLKGYAVLFALGLGLLGLAEMRHVGRVIGGAVLAVAVFVGPVIEHLPRGLEASVHRADMFWNIWYNHGFRHLAYNVAPALAGPGRVLLGLLALLATGAAWWRLRRASTADTDDTERSLWMVLFTTASLATMIGTSALSVAYNLMHVLPGALMLLAGQRRLREVSPIGSEPFVGLLLLLLAFMLFVFRLKSIYFPVAALGLLGLVLVTAWVALNGARRAPIAPPAGPA